MLPPPVHTQVPPLQVPAPQTVPHVPQLLGSVIVLTQRAPHIVRGDTHEAWQCPATQNSVAPHAVAQSPQCIGSVSVFTQLVPHIVPRAQPHVPVWQVSDPVQGIPQPPQFALSKFVLTHEPEQFVWPPAQASVHAPREQTCVEVHTVPQVPQWSWSLRIDTQVLPQRT